VSSGRAGRAAWATPLPRIGGNEMGRARMRELWQAWSGHGLQCGGGVAKAVAEGIALSFY